MDERLRQCEAQRHEHAAAAAAAQVEMARCEQKLEGLRLQLTQVESDKQERATALARVETELEQAQQRHLQATREMLRLSSQRSLLAWQTEGLAREAARFLAERAGQAQARQVAAKELEQVRQLLAALQQRRHQLEMAAGELRLERAALLQRLQDDYGIDLAALEAAGGETEAARQEVEAEIAELRRKLNQMGNVNLEALDELEALEERFALLHGQFQDLTKAKESLQRIIEKTNVDSRRLFLDTLEAIRVNFQQLFRRVFGGGRADIVLEEGVDLLDAGVEIVATPPGKQSLSISLLSGGEKALTAVTLLLAIFQVRPSPFCVLDEVDGPLDEANIGRFIDVLKEFLSWTKFIVVTHSKKTMTAATTLYGVTMQESGISKRVSVRFEDVSEDGHISSAALQRSETTSEPPGSDSQRGVA